MKGEMEASGGATAVPERVRWGPGAFSRTRAGVRAATRRRQMEGCAASPAYALVELVLGSGILLRSNSSILGLVRDRLRRTGVVVQALVEVE